MEALGRALRLDEDELGHLHDLVVRAARHTAQPPTAPSRTVSPQVRQLLESLLPSPAYVTSRTLDLLAHNAGAINLYAGIEDWPAKQRNLARFLFLHPAARDLYADWDTQTAGYVARLRALAGTDPDAPDLAGLVGELLLKSKDFAKLWERYEVTRRTHTRKPKTFRHPQVGEIALAFQGMHLEGTPGHRLGVYVAAPGTPEHDAVVLLDMITPLRNRTRQRRTHGSPTSTGDDSSRPVPAKPVQRARRPGAEQLQSQLHSLRFSSVQPNPVEPVHRRSEH